MGCRARLVAALCASAVWVGAGVARADAALGAAALLSEPVGYTDVADAFEPGDPLDVNVELAFSHSESSAAIEREIIDATSFDGVTSRNFVDVARHRGIDNQLALLLEVGVYHDLMVFLRLPVILGEDHELRPPDGQRCDDGSDSSACAALLEPLPDGSSQALFDLSMPFTSKRRSGVAGVDLGAAWSVTNQYRTSYLPTWVLIAQGTIDTGSLRRPCEAEDSCEPGVGTGTDRFTLESRWSYRFRHLEPLFGIAQTFQWIGRGDKRFNADGGEGVIDGDPPWTTTMTLGTAVIPWEDRPRFQRFEVEIKGEAAFIGAGQDYSPMFDALGTSPLLTADADSNTIHFTGLTQVEAHARLGLQVTTLMRAARYVSFALGLGISHETPHLLTGSAACNTAVETTVLDPRAGGCVEGIVNPLYRPAIDTPGQRFRLVSEVSWTLLTAAMGRF